MTVAIFWIAALPTIAIFFVAASTGSRLKTILMTLVVALAGALSGNPIYTSIDVVAAAIALVFCWIVVLPAPRQKSGDEMRWEQAQKAARQKKFQQFIVGAIALAVIVLFWNSKVPPYQAQVQPQPQSVATPTTNPRCAGNSGVAKCEAFERQRAAESNSQALARSASLEDQRSRNMEEVNKQGPLPTEAHRKAKSNIAKRAKLPEIPDPIAYDPPGGTSAIQATPLPATKQDPNVLDPGGHQGYPPECHWLSMYEWSCKK